ncbi:MAG: radical SAM protein [Candidatus Tectomicrobia bacterium]|nr:radical SAM protein [Candidatus Tectomicrobia bacterium]
MKVVLLSAYDLGRQPFGLASPAAWLRKAGAEVSCQDLSVDRLDEAPIRSADLVAFYVPMHTATRIAVRTLERVKSLNPAAHLCFYGLYAPVNEPYLRRLGVQTLLGGEFEEGIVELARRLAAGEGGDPRQQGPVVSLKRLKFEVPDRSGLPELSRYARLALGDGRIRTVGYTEASRGCKHLCRHCPVVPVYQGVFRVVQREVVLEDIRRQVARGARHITFGDPDFFNGVRHAVQLVKSLHGEFPHLTYDVTIKVEHLLKHASHLPALRDTGCLFVTSAVESIDDRVLQIFDKGHTREDFLRVVRQFREVGLNLNPTFVTFTPWATIEGYRELLSLLLELDLVEQVSPVQLAIRLLIPAGSRLMELPAVREAVAGFDEAALSHLWEHEDPRVDRLHLDVLDIVKSGEARGESRRQIFAGVWRAAHLASGVEEADIPDLPVLPSRSAIPFLTEPWYC